MSINRALTMRKLTGGAIANKRKLTFIKSKIEESIKDVGTYVQNILLLLLEVEQKQLYFYDRCKSITEFIVKNKYPQKLSVSIFSVIRQLRAIEYAKSRKISRKEIQRIGASKLDIMRHCDVDNKTEIINLGNYTIPKLKSILGFIKDKNTGRFISFNNKFERRPNTNLRNWMIEIPKENNKDFEAEFIQLCTKYNVKLP